MQLEVSQASKDARIAVEKAGGKVTRVFYNQHGLHYLLKVGYNSLLLAHPSSAGEIREEEQVGSYGSQTGACV